MTKSTSTRRGLLPHLPLRTRRLLLRPFALSDADAIFRLHGDPDVMRHAGGTKTLEESRRALARLIEKVEATGLGALAVEEVSSCSVIGWCGVQQIPGTEDLEVIYALMKDRWGQGLALEAARSTVATGFDALQADCIHGLVYPENQRSVRILEKLGMTMVRPYFDSSSLRQALLYGVTRTAFQSSSKK